MGAIVRAFDVRPSVADQIKSLGGEFLTVDIKESGEGQGGYAKEMSKEYQAKQAALTAEHIKKQDIVITTALIPGRPAPKLVSAAMVASMKPGSVIVDLAAERGGNVELTQPGKAIVTANGVTILAYTNVPGRLATSASQLYARNLNAFLETLVDKKEQKLAVNWDDELVKATVLTRDGAIVHPNIKLDAVTAAPAPAVKPAGPPAKTVPVAQAATPPRPPVAAPVATEAAVVSEAAVAEAVPAAPVKTVAAKNTTAKKTAAAPASITDVPPLPAAKAPAKRTAKTAVATSEAAAAPKSARKPAAKKPAASKGTT
jgi:NAD(P) transhydrogenase subunit alpha